ncbi:hypothetical protein GCM10009574_083500 [Streptomyces asiaticus]
MDAWVAALLADMARQEVVMSGKLPAPETGRFTQMPSLALQNSQLGLVRAGSSFGVRDLARCGGVDVAGSVVVSGLSHWC